MKKKVFSFSNFWTTLISLILLLICILIYIITGLQISSANAKRSDLVRYSSLYESSFIYSQSELKSFAETTVAEHYNNYYGIVTGDGNLVLSRKMLEEIGLEKDEKAILDEFDNTYTNYIEPANKTAIDSAVLKSDFAAAKSAIATKEYSDYLTYGSVCLNTLSESVCDRMNDTIKRLNVKENIIMICMLLLCILFGGMMLLTYMRLKALAKMAETETEHSNLTEQEE